LVCADNRRHMNLDTAPIGFGITLVFGNKSNNNENHKCRQCDCLKEMFLTDQPRFHPGEHNNMSESRNVNQKTDA
jgi:hypothetical protein